MPRQGSLAPCVFLETAQVVPAENAEETPCEGTEADISSTT